METFNTHGGYFAPQGLMRIESGGSHESNPNGGVQIGVDPNGVPNMVEQDETIYKDFVFSDNITADREMLKQAGLPVQYAGDLYSDIADKLVDSAEENPNDAIANNTINAMLARLAEAQETQKQQEEQRQLEEELSKLSPEELAELEAMLSQQGEGQGGQQMPPEEMMQYEQMMPPEQMQQEPQQPQMFREGGFTDDEDGEGPEARPEYRQGEITQLNPSRFELWADDFKDKHRDGLALLNGLNKTFGTGLLLASLPGTGGATGALGFAADAGRGAKAAGKGLGLVKSASTDKAILSRLNTIKNVAHPVKRWVLGHPNALNDAAEAAGKNWGWFKKGATWMLSPTTMAVDYGLSKGVPAAYDALTHDDFAALKDVQQEEPNDSATYDFKAWGFADGGRKLPVFPRYAGALTSGAVGLYDAFQKPDSYTYKHIRPRMSGVSFNYIDPVYRPMDSNVAANTLLGASAGTSRGLSNSGLGPSTAGALIAADYNTGRNIGNVYSQIGEYNTNLYNNILAQRNANRQAAAQLDMYRDNYNNQLAYQAALNDRNEDIRRQMYYQNSESQKYAALQNQIDQVAQALSAIGNENVAFNWANNDDTYDYIVDLMGPYFKARKGSYEGK